MDAAHHTALSLSGPIFYSFIFLSNIIEYDEEEVVEGSRRRLVQGKGEIMGFPSLGKGGREQGEES